MNSLIQKLGVLQDPMADAQVDNFIRGHIPFLGLRATAPDTTGWDTNKVCLWLELSGAVYVMKFWDGAAVKTVTTT
jgi:hypothetical protein